MLKVNNIEVIYSDVILVLKGLSMVVPEGQIVALLGANGAGKSTTLKAISGLLKSEEGEVTDGEILFAGEKINGKDPEEIVRKGIFQVIEGRRVFERRACYSCHDLEGFPKLARIGPKLAAIGDRVLEPSPLEARGIRPTLPNWIFTKVRAPDAVLEGARMPTLLNSRGALRCCRLPATARKHSPSRCWRKKRRPGRWLPARPIPDGVPSAPGDRGESRSASRSCAYPPPARCS